MTIGLLGPAANQQLDRLDALLGRDASDSVLRLESAFDGIGRAALDDRGLSWNGQDLSTLTALYVHGFRYEDPVIPVDRSLQDWSLWQTGGVIDQQSYSFLYSCLARLEAQGVALVNGPSAHVTGFARGTWLARLHRAGQAVPATLVTNDDDAVGRFLARHTPVIWRPVTGPAAWQLFTERQRRHLVARDKPPVMLAQVIPGPILRLYVLDGQIVLATRQTHPHRGEVERLEAFETVDASVATAWSGLSRAIRHLGLRFAQVLAVETDTSVVVYDVDVDPVVTDLPNTLTDYLLTCLATRLRGSGDLPQPPVPGRHDRPALLLRRMLAVQFDMEATKYAQP